MPQNRLLSDMNRMLSEPPSRIPQISTTFTLIAAVTVLGAILSTMQFWARELFPEWIVSPLAFSVWISLPLLALGGRRLLFGILLFVGWHVAMSYAPSLFAGRILCKLVQSLFPIILVILWAWDRHSLVRLAGAASGYAVYSVIDWGVLSTIGGGLGLFNVIEVLSPAIAWSFIALGDLIACSVQKTGSDVLGAMKDVWKSLRNSWGLLAFLLAIVIAVALSAFNINHY